MSLIKDKVSKWIRELELTTQEKKLFIQIIVFTMILSLILLVQDGKPFSGILQKNTYGEGSRIEVLEVAREGIGRNEIEISVWEVGYTDEELEVAFQNTIEVLDDLILGENESADEIYYSLNLVEEIADTGIQVSWTWEPYEALDMDGKIQEQNIEEEGMLVTLQGTLSYGEIERYYLQSVYIYPELKDEETIFLEALQEEIQELQEAGITEGELILPSSIDGIEISWYRGASSRSLYVLLMGCTIIILLLARKGEIKKREEDERKSEMLKAYPNIIHTFALYLGAGMTVKTAWKRMVLEQNSCGPIYEEMKRTYYEMTNGICESECYESFANRCGLRSYQRFGLLLSQNVRKGTKGLTMLLEREAWEAFEERKIRAREEGEKAGTKLLMPMFAMLIVVLMIMIVPAFISIQI